MARSGRRSGLGGAVRSEIALVRRVRRGDQRSHQGESTHEEGLGEARRSMTRAAHVVSCFRQFLKLMCCAGGF